MCFRYEFHHIVETFGMTCSETNHLVFYCHTLPGNCVYSNVYVDDIVILGSDATKISLVKEHLCNRF